MFGLNVSVLCVHNISWLVKPLRITITFNQDNKVVFTVCSTLPQFLVIFTVCVDWFLPPSLKHFFSCYPSYSWWNLLPTLCVFQICIHKVFLLRSPGGIYCTLRWTSRSSWNSLGSPLTGWAQFWQMKPFRSDKWLSLPWHKCLWQKSFESSSLQVVENHTVGDLVKTNGVGHCLTKTSHVCIMGFLQCWRHFGQYTRNRGAV